MPLKIESDRTLLALVVTATEPMPQGIAFYTDASEQLQLAGMRHVTGHEIKAHTHNFAPRTIDRTHEALFVRRGRVKMDVYDERRVLVRTVILGAGDVVLLLAGGHGFTILEDADILEVKQGPFLGDWEKTRFGPAA